jgi:sugar (pentulose or hexulose) kinase
MDTSTDECVLAIDIGSSAVRAAVVNADGRRISEKRTARTDSLSGVTFDANLLLDETFATIAALPDSAKRAVRTVAVAGHIGTVFCDAEAEPVGAASGWADSSGVVRLTEALSQSPLPYGKITGRPLPGGGALAALLDMRANSADRFSRIRKVLQPKDLIVARLTGVIASDRTSAAYSGAYDVRRFEWSDDILATLGLGEGYFPPTYQSTEVVGRLLPGPARSVGLPLTAKVVAGGPDGTLGATYVLRDATSAVADIAGTTDVIVRVSDRPPSSESEAILNPYTLPGLWSYGGATGMTGGAVDAWARLLGLESAGNALDQNHDQMAQIAPGSDGLAIFPSLSGSRFPRWSPDDRGLLSGLTESHTSAHLMRAAFEGAAFVVREALDAVSSRDADVVLAGGAARSLFLAQMRADIFNRRVLVSEEADVSLMGAAMIAASGGLGAYGREAWARFDRPVQVLEPDPSRTSAYQERFLEWQHRTAEECR